MPNDGTPIALPAPPVRRDPDSAIVGFLQDHPGSTVAQLATGLDLGYELVAGHMTRLLGTGETERAAHGFRISGPDRPQRVSAVG